MILALFLPLALKEQAAGPLETALKPEQPINRKDWMFKLRNLDAEELSQREVTQLVATIILSLSFLPEQRSCQSAAQRSLCLSFTSSCFHPIRHCAVPLLKHRLNSQFIFFSDSTSAER